MYRPGSQITRIVRILELDHQPALIKDLSETIVSRLRFDVPLARYMSSRLGGSAEALIEVESVDDLESVVIACWELNIPIKIIGGGSNLLVSDAGVSGLVIVNRARKVRFEIESVPPLVWAESGANFGLLARKAANIGLLGLEWAAGIPGTLGGAIVGNAGAHGGSMAGNLRLAEILHRIDIDRKVDARREEWPSENAGIQLSKQRPKAKTRESNSPGSYSRIAAVIGGFRANQDE